MANTRRKERGGFRNLARGATIIQIQTCPIARTRRIIPGDLIRTFAIAGAKAKFKTAPTTKKRRNETAGRLPERDTRAFSASGGAKYVRARAEFPLSEARAKRDSEKIASRNYQSHKHAR